MIVAISVSSSGSPLVVRPQAWIILEYILSSSFGGDIKAHDDSIYHSTIGYGEVISPIYNMPGPKSADEFVVKFDQRH